jgi:deoxyadenosine/deoxycytidine kinase
MDTKYNIIAIEGSIGIGKTTLLKNFDLERYNGVVEILYEPHEQFNNFMDKYKPLDLFYSNPKENAIISQIHIFDTCKEYLKKKLYELSPKCKVLITDRSIESPIIFLHTLRDMGYITEYQFDFLIEYANRHICEMEKEFQVVKPSGYFFLMNNPSISVPNIEKREFSKENQFPALRYYLHILGKNMNYFMALRKQKVPTYWEKEQKLEDRVSNLHYFLEHFY